MLKAMLKSLDEIDEKYRDLYEEVGEGDEKQYVLGVDDKEYKSKIAEFRDNNIKYKKDIDELNKALKELKDGGLADIDPEKYKAMEKELEEIKDKKLMDEGQFEELLEKRTERLREKTSNQIKQLEENLVKANESVDLYRGKWEEIVVNDAILRSVEKVGAVKKGAMTDILSRARSLWKINGEEGGKLQAKDGDGNVLYGESGKEPLTVDEWVATLATEASHLFEGNSGGGASGSGNNSGTGTTRINPDDKAAFTANIEDIAAGKVVVGS